MTQIFQMGWKHTRRGITSLLWLSILGYGLVSLGFIVMGIIGLPNRAMYEFAATCHKLALFAVPILLLVVVIFRRWRLTVLLLPSVIVFALYYAPYFTPKSHTSVDDTPQLSVMTFNILQRYRDMYTVAHIISESDADVVAIQELSFVASRYLADALAERYPYQALHPHGGRHGYWMGQGVFSKYPIVEDEFWNYIDLTEEYDMNLSHGHQRVAIDLDGNTVVLYNTHAWPPIDWLGNIRFQFSPIEDLAHRTAIERIVERTLTETVPTLIVGDFNMSDQFHEYDLITDHYQDSWLNAGNGMGYSYPARAFMPLMRIDYVFHSDEWQSIHAQVWHDSGASDHYPVRITLALTNTDTP